MRTKFTHLLSLTIVLAMFSVQLFGQTLLNENFNSYEGDAPDPAGWNELNGVTSLQDSTSHWEADYSIFNSDTVSAKATFGSWNSEAKNSWLVTPTLDLTQNGGQNRLNFYYKANKSDFSAKDSVSVMISVDGGSTFELVETIKGNLPTEWFNKIIDLSAWGTSSNVKLAFFFHDDTEEDVYNKFYLDDVIVEAIPAHDFAVIPGLMDNRSLQDTTVYVGESANFHMMVKNYGTTTENAPVKWTVETGSPTSNSENTSTLAAGEGEHFQFSTSWNASGTNGVYTLKVFTDHASDANRANDTATIKLTVYQPYQYFSENFDAAEEWPFAWNATPEGTYDLKVIEDSYYANSNPNCIKFNSGAGEGWKAITPAVEVVNGESYRLQSYLSGSSGAKVAIGTISEFMDTSTFVPKDTAVIQENYTYQVNEVVFDSPGIKQIAYKYLESGKYLYIDDVTFEQIDPYDLAAERVTSSAAIVEGTTYNHKVELKNKGFNDETFDLSVSGQWSYEILDQDTQNQITELTLNSNEVDTVLVQATAPSGITDSTSDQMTFIATSQQNTDIADTVYANTYAYEYFAGLDEGFEEAEEIPFAWTALDPEDGNVNVYSSSYSAHTGSNYVQLSNTETGTLVGVMSPALEQANLYRLNFYHKEAGTLLVGKTSNPDDLSTIDTLGEYTGGYSYSQVELTFSANSSPVYLVFLHEVDGGYDNVLIDDITLEKVEPYAVEITENSPDSYAPADMSKSYFAEIKNSGYEDETFDLSVSGNWNYTILNKEQDTNINSITIPSGTKDSVYVQANVPSEGIQNGDTDEAQFVVASQNDESVTDTAFITTEAYNPYTSFMEGFEASTELPDYWQGLKFYSYSSAGVNTYGGFNSDHSAELYESSSASGHSYIITPATSKQGKRYKLSFYSKCYSSGDHLMVGTMTDPADTNSFEVLDTISVTSNYSKDSLEIYLEENSFIAFATTTTGNTVNIDNIQLGMLPAVSVFPEDSSEHIAVDTSVMMQFNKPIRNLDNSELTNDDLDALVTLKENGAEGTDVPFDATINGAKTEITVLPNDSLKGETTYYAAFADSAVEDTNNNSVPGKSVTFTTTDIAAPMFVDDYPKIMDTTQHSFEFAVQLNEAGKFNYIVVPGDAAVPNVNQVITGDNYGQVEVIAGDMIVVNEGNLEIKESVPGLSMNTEYSLYIVAQDDAAEPNIQNTVTAIDITTLGDQTAPQFVDGYPNVTNVTETSFELQTQINEAGTIYYVVVENNAKQPTSSEVKEGADYAGVSIISNGHLDISEDSVTVTKVIEGLTANTDYDAYVVAEDSAEAPNLQNNPVMVEVSTNAATGLANRNDDRVTVYPNPVNQWLKLESSKQIQNIKVYNLLGNVQKEVYKVNRKSFELNFDDISEGIYLIKITDINDNIIIKKVQKK